MVSLLYDIGVNLFIKIESGAIFKGFSCKGVDGQSGGAEPSSGEKVPPLRPPVYPEWGGTEVA
jgi:hypothetical protein